MEIIIALIVIALGWSYLKARARIHYANNLKVGRELEKYTDAPYPSWITDEDRMQEFFAMLKAMAKRKNIPEKYLGGVLQHEYSQNRLFFVAGLMEQQGASFEEQTLSVMDHVERYWSNTEDKQMWFN